MNATRAFGTRRLGPRLAALAALAALTSGGPLLAQDAARPAPTVGMPGRVEELVLPGPELEVRPRAAHDPLVLRITRVSPHGSDFRYDFEYVGLEPGAYDLRDALRRRDGTPLAAEPTAAGALPSIPVEVRSLLEPGVVKPHAPEPRDVPSFGGYTTLLVAGAVVWLAGMALILFGWRKRRLAAAVEARPPTLAERLCPLVERALAGRLTREERAQLELGLVAYWRRKLGLEHERPAALHARLREHAEAGPLIAGLEAWLHMPVPPRDVDVPALLAPYRDLPADAMPELFDLAPGAGRAVDAGGAAR